MPAVMDVQGVENSRFHPSVLDLDRPGFTTGRAEKSLLRKVRKLVEDFPDQALTVIRGWMAQGN